jgi:hypothetical protein
MSAFLSGEKAGNLLMLGPVLMTHGRCSDSCSQNTESPFCLNMQAYIQHIAYVLYIIYTLHIVKDIIAE